MTKNFSLYRFRWLLYELVIRDLVVRYRGSVLGVAWTLLNPLLFMAVYTLVFSIILRSTIHDYPLFLLAGLIPWIWISTAISTAVTSISGGGAYVGKTLMPSHLLVLVPVLSNGLNFFITILLLFPVSVILGVHVLWALLFLPILVTIELCMTLGISLFVATANVFYRDLQQIIGYVMTAAFFLTPIFYAKSAIPANLQFLVAYNPLAGLFSAYQSVFYKGMPPDMGDLLSAAIFAGIVLVVGVVYFNSARDGFGELV